MERSHACPAIVVLEPLWVQASALLPTRQDTHPLGCHRSRIPDRIVFDKLIQVLVFGCGYRRLADHTCSATILRRRRDEWIALGLAEQLRRAALGAYDRLFGLELEHLAVDGCITKSPCGGQVAGPSPVDRRKQGLKRSVLTDAGGIPLAALPTKANHRDDGLLAATLDAVGLLGPLPQRPTVHLDAGYDYQPCRQVLSERGMVGQIATRGKPAPGAGQPPLAHGAHPRVGQPVRQAALVHRTPQDGGGGVLAGAGQRRHHLRPAGPPRLGLLPLGQPTPPPPITYWRRPLVTGRPACSAGPLGGGEPRPRECARITPDGSGTP
jgi:transposase